MDTAAALRIRLFRPGTFVSAEGRTLSFSAADLAGTAAAYDPQANPAPLVIGHPKINDPAWGWVKGLTVEDGELVAEPERIDATFAEAVRGGRYAKVSAQFYLPDDPVNPAPGKWYLRHIGFLGAAAPAVKGLGTVAFSADVQGVATIEISKTESGMDDKSAADAASFAERDRVLGEREAVLAAREKALADEARAARHESHVSFAEGLSSAGRLAPAGKGLVIGLLDQLGELPGTASFAEAGELAPAAALRKLLDTSVPLISFAEHAKPEDEQEYADVASFAAPQGAHVEASAAEHYQRARAIQVENPGMSIIEASKRASAR